MKREGPAGARRAQAVSLRVVKVTARSRRRHSSNEEYDPDGAMRKERMQVVL